MSTLFVVGVAVGGLGLLVIGFCLGVLWIQQALRRTSGDHRVDAGKRLSAHKRASNSEQVKGLRHSLDRGLRSRLKWSLWTA